MVSTDHVTKIRMGVIYALVSVVMIHSFHIDAKASVKGIDDVLTDVENKTYASVDGDPEFLVGVLGLTQPLCFRLEGQSGQVVRLLQDPESGVVVNARISRPVPGSKRTYLSAVLISRRNFLLVAKVGRVLVNRYRFAWGPVAVRLVHGHRVLIAPTLMALTLRNRNVTLVVRRHLPEGRSIATNSSSAPNTASSGTGLSRSRGGGSNVDVTSGRRQRGRGRPKVIMGPRRRSRRRPAGGRTRTQSKGQPVPARDTQKRYLIDDSLKNADFDSQVQGPKTDKMFIAYTDRQKSRTFAESREAGTTRNRHERSAVKVLKADAGKGDPGSGDKTTAAPRLPSRENVAYMGFYVADARDLSEETHGLLGQFLHKSVILQKVRRKANGAMKARLLVEKPRPHHVKAKLRRRANLALNTSSTCWWLQNEGAGVVDGAYSSYVVPKFRDTAMLPLPADRFGQ